MMRRLAAIALVLVICGSAARLPPVAGGVPAQRTLLRQILSRMGPLHFTRAEILVARTHHWRKGPPGAVLVRFHAPAYDLRLEWEAWMVAGALHHLSGVVGLPPLIALETATGNKLATGARVPGPYRTHVPRATRAAAARLRSKVLRAARESGAHVEQLVIVRPYGLGYALVLRAVRPAAYLKYHAPTLLRRLPDTRKRYEGDYIELVDKHGHRAWAASSSTRLGAGGTWARPDLEGCNPTPPLSYGAGHKVPRCPV